MKKLRILKWAALLGVMAIALYFLLLRPHHVTPLQPSRGTVLVEALGTGSVESRQTIELGFEVTGRVSRLEVDQGDLLEEGQVLAAIEDITFRAEVELEQEEVQLARSTLLRLDAEIDRAEAVLEGAASNLGRFRPLVESGVASLEDLDVAEERHEVALAELARAKAAEMEGKRALATAERRLARAEADLARTVVTSPTNGVVLRREREVGDVAVPGASVLRIASTETVWASVWVDETYLASLALDLPARIALRSDPDRILPGRVARIGREVDRETRELLVDVAFEDPPENLLFGQRVDLRIELARSENVTRIPVAVLARSGGAEGIFVARDGRARFLPIEVGTRGRDFVEVAGGLPGDAVVLPSRYTNGRVVSEGDRLSLIPDEEASR